MHFCLVSVLCNENSLWAFIMKFSTFACGFNGLYQIGSLDDASVSTWCRINDALLCEPCLSLSWNSLYICANGN